MNPLRSCNRLPSSKVWQRSLSHTSAFEPPSSAYSCSAICAELSRSNTSSSIGSNRNSGTEQLAGRARRPRLWHWSSPETRKCGCGHRWRLRPTMPRPGCGRPASSNRARAPGPTRRSANPVVRGTFVPEGAGHQRIVLEPRQLPADRLQGRLQPQGVLDKVLREPSSHSFEMRVLDLDDMRAACSLQQGA